jgi:hypothetical protein
MTTPTYTAPSLVTSGAMPPPPTGFHSVDLIQEHGNFTSALHAYNNVPV